jgi:hypothetical protein
MKNSPKVFGLILAKNEWPLLALSVSHALMHHVDEVYLFNHASTDRTLEGLRHLQKLWNNRIHIFNWNDERYWQEVFTNVLIMMSKASSPDWFYVFDADEFLITRDFRSLKRIVSDVDQKYSAIRYEVQNWISTEEFDETDPHHYRMLRYRSVANSFIEMHPSVYIDEILNGNLNFFDVPFRSKVIFRNDGELWLEAGAHNIRKPVPFYTLAISTDELRAAHFPLFSRQKLERKVKHGRRLILDAFPPTHGWQSQMIYEFSQQNKLDEFWHSHTIPSGNKINNRTVPSHIIEDGFVQTIEPTLHLIEKSLDLSLLASGKQDLSTLDNSAIPFSIIVPLAQSIRSMLLERDKLIAERDAAVIERDAVVAERDATVAERDATVAERDAAMAERNEIVAERDALVSSLSWRYTEFIRRIFSYARSRIKSVKNCQRH